MAWWEYILYAGCLWLYWNLISALIKIIRSLWND
jgi:hypothetical protein